MSSNSILVDFNMLIDIDLGLINLLKNEYKDNDFIEPYIYKLNNKILIGMILSNKDKNPLSLFLKNEYKDSADSLYNEFLNGEYDKVLEYSTKTNIIDLVNTYISTCEISVTVICKNKSEEQIINRYNSNIKTIIISKYKDIDLSLYDTIFIKDYSKVTEFTKLTAKNIFIGNYKYNLQDDSDIPLEEISILIGDINIVSIIDVYQSNKYIKVLG